MPIKVLNHLWQCNMLGLLEILEPLKPKSMVWLHRIMEICLSYGRSREFIRVWASLVSDPELAGLIAWRSEQRWHTTMARGMTVFIPTKSSLDRWLLIGAQPRSCLSSIEHVPLCSGGTWRVKVTEECWDLELLSIPAWGLSNGLGLLRWHVSGREPKDGKGQRTGWGDWLIVIDSDFNRAHMSNFISFQRWTKIGLEARFYQSKNYSQSKLCQFGCAHTHTSTLVSSCEFWMILSWKTGPTYWCFVDQRPITWPISSRWKWNVRMLSAGLQGNICMMCIYYVLYYHEEYLFKFNTRRLWWN